MKFDRAFEILVDPQHEGAYVNDPKDPGGETKFGVSKRSYPGEDIANLTLERAKQIYARDFWGPAGCDAVPDLVKYQLFDMAVNMGPKTSIKLLQRAVGAADDGILGPKTLQRVQSAGDAWLLRRLQAAAIRYYATLPTWPAYGRGWMNRLATNMENA